MNRYSHGGPSKATASTTCQKCLKKDSYECKAIVQERPYVSRPSRTQQLTNPKLVPKLTSDVPQDLLRKKGIADEQLAKLEQERGRKRERYSEDTDGPTPSKRMRSASLNSVSTISTSLSRSPSPSPDRATISRNPESTSFSQSPLPRNSVRQIPRPSFSRSPSPRPRTSESERKRRRNSGSSVDSSASDDAGNSKRDSRERASSRSTRRKFNKASPPARGRRTESASPHGGRRLLSNDRQRVRGQHWNHAKNGAAPCSDLQESKATPRDKSLSPFSKRLALTQAMNLDR